MVFSIPPLELKSLLARLVYESDTLVIGIYLSRGPSACIARCPDIKVHRLGILALVREDAHLARFQFDRSPVLLFEASDNRHFSELGVRLRKVALRVYYRRLVVCLDDDLLFEERALFNLQGLLHCCVARDLHVPANGDIALYGKTSTMSFPKLVFPRRYVFITSDYRVRKACYLAFSPVGLLGQSVSPLEAEVDVYESAFQFGIGILPPL